MKTYSIDYGTITMYENETPISSISEAQIDSFDSDLMELAHVAESLDNYQAEQKILAIICKKYLEAQTKDTQLKSMLQLATDPTLEPLRKIIG